MSLVIPTLLTPRFLIDNVPSVKLLPFLVCLTLSASGLHGSLAQSTQVPEWPTGSFDQQRDAWQRNETKFTVDNVKNTRLLWKLKTDNKPMGMQSFREPIIVAGVTTPTGAKTIAILAGSSDDVYAVDVSNGTLLWQKHLKWSSDKPEEAGEGAGFICNNALTATPVVTPAGARPALCLRAHQRRLPAHPGAVHRRRQRHAHPDDPRPVRQGIRPEPLRNNIVYTVTGQACHGVPNELYAVDLTTKKAFSSTPSQGGIFGTAGPAIGTDGTIYLETGDGVYDLAVGKLSTTVLAYTESATIPSPSRTTTPPATTSGSPSETWT